MARQPSQQALSALLERRLRRAEALESLWPESAEVLRFFRRLTEVQREILPSVGAGPESLAPSVARLLDGIASVAPAPLAARFAGWKAASWNARLSEAWEARAEAAADPVEGFVPRALLQVFAMATVPPTPAGAPSGSCPACGAPPVVSLLRETEDASAVARSLVCSCCPHPWDFPRVVCPGCGEEDPDKLPRFAPDEIPWMRLEACDTCGRCLKSVDLTREPQAEPITDEVAATALDVIGREAGYVKLATNIVGL